MAKAKCLIERDELGHCWHPNQTAHLVLIQGGRHVDELCCWCGEERCLNVAFAQTSGHGEYVRESRSQGHDVEALLLERARQADELLWERDLARAALRELEAERDIHRADRDVALALKSQAERELAGYQAEFAHEVRAAREASREADESFLDSCVLACAIDAYLAGSEAQHELLTRWKENGNSKGLSGNVLEIALQMVRRRS